MRRAAGRTRLLAPLLVAVLALAGCSFGGSDGSSEPSPSPTSATPAADLVDSQFTRDGTFQSHLSVKNAKGIDFVYTMYPTKATPRTNEWYPLGKKYFSFTFQAYDLSRKLRDPFATKRLVYLDTMKVSSATVTADGGKTQHPFKLNVTAADATFDPQPVTSRYGMLITSPKGAFELRNNEIGKMSLDTRGVNLTFKAVVYVQAKVGSSTYLKRTVTQVVPIAIFESKDPTAVADIPINAN
ncbi:hypothetical protein BH11ACT8_BH11ACT8_17410 [soil metagenome]